MTEAVLIAALGASECSLTLLEASPGYVNISSHVARRTINPDSST